ncbi:RagB/SusD family nutrient uptake outer membrane protein [Pedobacter glucosidilyticus]|uniref:RagB/SusD family nutrient uptake outer membrane protein n=1 Tax=Pedobacter glucosidilyticus TaxID=1122941 RepID=UPI00041C0FDF|nr:RagB/SusD family nutrient uptake outer membrane protein [Pedobacter glucosidilyticus]
MKKYILIIVIAFLSSSCSNNLDKILPRDAISQDQLTDSDIGKLRNGVYASVETGIFNFTFDFDIRADNFRGGPGFSLVDPVNMNPSDPSVLSLWRNAYNRIADINFLLETLDKSPNQTGNLQTFRGEALYFRALMYYQLVTRWGGVPLLTSRTFDVVQRSTEAQVWQQIIDDLIAAENLLPNFSNKFFVSKQAAQALLARVYLATNDKPNAVIYSDRVITYGTVTTSSFSLATDANGYASNFIANTPSREVIFAFVNNNSNNRKVFYQRVNDVDPTWEYSPTINLHANLYANAINPLRTGDKRRTAVFSNDNTRLIKYPNGRNGQQLVSTSNADFTPIMVSRFSEMLLIKAEALGVGSAAETALAPYFTARYTVAPVTGSIAALNATDFQNLILDERQREFYGEGYRWYDIKRTNRLDLLPSLAGRNYLLFYPIPQVEIDLAKYGQNIGYD